MSLFVPRFRGRAKDAGITLVEVLVSMGILGVVLTLVTGFMIKTLDQQSNLSQQSEAQNRNNTGMELMSRLLRQAILPPGAAQTATIVTTATPTQIVFSSRMSDTTSQLSACTGTVVNCSTSNVPTKNYIFTLSGTTLKWGQAATGTTPTATDSIVFGVQNAGGTAACSANTSNSSSIFHYFWVDTNGNPTELTNVVGGVAQPLTATQLAEIQYIEVDLYTQTKTGPAAPLCVPLQDYVELRN